MKPCYNSEYPRRVRLAAIGCGGHALRNIFPTFVFAPVELVAVCDLDLRRAEQCAALFGARDVYSDYRSMLEKERPAAVVVVTNYDENGMPRYPAIAMDVMRAGAHAWIEKPPAGASEQVRQMMAVSGETGRFVAVGLKKMFFPAIAKAKQIIATPTFGPVTSITARYPQYLPPLEQRSDRHRMLGFLDHIVHPYSILRLLAGGIDSIYVERADSGASVTSIRFTSGAVGSLHLSAGQSMMGSLEHTEVVGQGAHVVIENNLRVNYYRPGAPEGGYGRAEDYYGPEETAPLRWEPEFSLGQLYNKGIFLLGYAPEIRYFCNCVLNEQPPEVGNLDDALELMRVYEAYCRPDGQRIQLQQGM